MFCFALSKSCLWVCRRVFCFFFVCGRQAQRHTCCRRSTRGLLFFAFCSRLCLVWLVRMIYCSTTPQIFCSTAPEIEHLFSFVHTAHYLLGGSGSNLLLLYTVYASFLGNAVALWFYYRGELLWLYFCIPTTETQGNYNAPEPDRSISRCSAVRGSI